MILSKLLPKINPKMLVGGGLAIAFALLMIYSVLITGLMKRWKASAIEKEKEVGELTRFATNQTQATSFYINKYREKVAKVKVEEMSRKNVERLLNTREFEHLKHTDGLNRKLKNLEASLSYYASINGSSIPLIPKTLPCDSNKIRAFKWELVDEYNDIRATVLDTPKLHIRLPIRGAIYWEKKNRFLFIRFGKIEYYSEVYTPNKLGSIDSLDITFIRQGKRKRR